MRESAPESGKFIGTEPPPYENLPNRTGEDPHGAPRAAPAEQQLVSDFFDGAIRRRTTAAAGLLRGQLHRAVA